MIKRFRSLAAPFALSFALAFTIVAVAGLPGDARAASKKRVVDACAAAIKKEFGESPVEFDRFRRAGRKNNAFGELTLSDGTKAQIRCQYKGGRVRNVLFRAGNEQGRMWSKTRPEAAIFVEPEEKDDEDAKAGAGETKKAPDPIRPVRTRADGTRVGGPDEKADGDARTEDGDGDATKADADKTDADKSDADKADEKKAGGDGKADGDKTANADEKADKKDELVKPRFMKAPRR